METKIKPLCLFILLAIMSNMFISCQKKKEVTEFKYLIRLDDKEKKNANLTSVMDFQIAEFPDTEEGKRAEFGKKLIDETYNYFLDDKGNNINNQLACASCHLDSGTKAFGIPYVGVDKVFPNYRPREGQEGDLKDRINGCFERSMNGQKIEKDSEEMLAMIAYMEHLGKNVKDNKRIKGQKTPDLDKIPDRATDLSKGKIVYDNKCVVCHMDDGQGTRLHNSERGYLYPPLWGENSYNDGAGMNRVLTAAKFIKANMPLGASFENPQLTDEEAYDVAAYINSFTRPEKANKEKDYPKLNEKPIDSPYPPYDDDIPQEQHKYGPYNF